jgi:hypothetical protein
VEVLDSQHLCQIVNFHELAQGKETLRINIPSSHPTDLTVASDRAPSGAIAHPPLTILGHLLVIYEAVAEERKKGKRAGLFIVRSLPLFWFFKLANCL